MVRPPKCGLRDSGWTAASRTSPRTSIVGPDPDGAFTAAIITSGCSVRRMGRCSTPDRSAQMHWIDTTGSGTHHFRRKPRRRPLLHQRKRRTVRRGQWILKAGGAPAYQNANAEANAYLIDINNGVNGVSVTKLAPMAYPRGFSNGTILPNGQVVIVGGETYPVTFTDSTAVLIPEIWDPCRRGYSAS